MNRSTPKGWSTDAEYFKLCDDSSSGEDLSLIHI